MTQGVKITLITSGVFTVVAPAIGLLGTVGGMITSFNTLASSGAGDPERLSSGIGLSLLATLWGLFLGAISFAVFIGVLIYWLCTRDRQQSAVS